MPDYVDFFLNSTRDIIQFECVELSHTNFSKTYRLVRNATNGLTATLETAQEVVFEYCPMRISQGASEDNLEYSLNIEMGDVGEIIAEEMNNIVDGDPGLSEKPSFLYRTFRSDDLSAPMIGPIELEIVELNTTRTGSKFQARAPLLSITQTGIVYTIETFPMLKNFL